MSKFKELYKKYIKIKTFKYIIAVTLFAGLVLLELQSLKNFITSNNIYYALYHMIGIIIIYPVLSIIIFYGLTEVYPITENKNE